MTDARVLLVTCPGRDEAARLAHALVEEELAACVNVVGEIRSVYRWEGKVCDDAEVLCVVKTTAERFEAARARIVALHPYQVPEVIALPVVDGHTPYLEWLRAAVAGRT